MLEGLIRIYTLTTWCLFGTQHQSFEVVEFEMGPFWGDEVSAQGRGLGLYHKMHPNHAQIFALECCQKITL